MDNNNIILLNLEDKNINLEKSDISKINNVLYCNIVLNTIDEVCPECGSVEYVIKDYQIKKINHSVSTSSPCIIKYKARRYKCKYCGKIFYETNPFALVNEKVSTYTRIMVLEALRSHTATFTSVAKQYKLTTQTVMNIFDNWVDCSRKKLPEIICIDEIYTNKLSNTSKYACVLLNFKTREIVEIYSSRHKSTLANKFTSISLEERNNVKAIIIDMWEPYRELIHRYFKNSIVVIDSFHVIKHLNDAITKIRLKAMRKFADEKRSLSKKDKLIDKNMFYYMLKKFHFFFTKHYDDIYEGEFKIPKMKTKWKKAEILKYLLEIDDDLKYAYELKEKYREFNLCAKYESCDEEFDDLIKKFLNCRLEEYREFGRMINKWKIEIKNSFKRVSIGIDNKGKEIIKRLSNGPMEGTNSRLKCILKNANGYRNFPRFRNRCFFTINKNEPILGVPKNKNNK